MSGFLGAAVDALHALLMVLWVGGIPLLFWHAWPRLTRAYAVYAVGFIVLSQGSKALLGKCFLTSISKAAWQYSPAAGDSDEWFTVRLAEAVFHLSPTHRSITLVSEALVLLSAVGILFMLGRDSRRSRNRQRTAEPQRSVGELAPITTRRSASSSPVSHGPSSR